MDCGSSSLLGLAPFYFMLPQSKILFRIDPSVDFTKASKPEDVFNNVKIPVNYSLDDYYIRVTKNGNKWSEKFLYNHDPLFKKALEIK